MPNRPVFGRRVAQEMLPVKAARAVAIAPAAALQVVEPSTPGEEPLTVEQELQAWKDARGSRFKMPWSQLSLMASLCFGIASFVLPDSVNDNVEWLLWGLSAISAYVWWTNRKKKTKIEAPAAP